MTRLFRSLSLAGVAVAALSLSACDLTELNEDPNNPTQPTPSYILSSSQVNLADTYWDAFNNGRFALLYAQYWTQNQYTDEDRYQYRTAVVDAYWSDYYLAINNLEEVKRIISANESAYAAAGTQQAVAEVLQVWAFQNLTDTFGDIPYAEALQGAANPSPAYTPQEEIYPDLIARLTAAQAAIDPDATVPGDVIFGGDASKWKRFANSLKMRVAIRMADVMPNEAGQAIAQAVQAGAMTSNDDNALFDFQPSAPFSNPIWENYNLAGRDDWAVSDALVEELSSRDDPRLGIYVDPTPASAAGDPQYVGLDYGLAGGVAAAIPRNSFSRPGAAVRTQTAPAIFMLYDEVLFIRAEAAARGLSGATGDADDLFESAVGASVDYWTDGDDTDDYVDSLPTLTAGNYRQVLGVQKWLALYMQGLQGWSEWRRLGFTGVLEAPAGGKADQFDGPIAVRLVYPTTEGSLNAANLQAAIANQGADTQGTRVWWDASAND